MIDAMKKGLKAIQSCQWHSDDDNRQHKSFDEHLVSRAHEALHQAIAEAEKESTLQEISDIGQEIEQEPESWMGVSDNPYCNDSDCNDPNSRAMRWHNNLLELRKPKNELDAIDRAYFAGKEAGIAECEAIAKLREKNT
jgi:hypothetical protein